jgi:hypothetical protein
VPKKLEYSISSRANVSIGIRFVILDAICGRERKNEWDSGWVGSWCCTTMSPSSLETMDFRAAAPTFEYLERIAEAAVASTVGAVYLVNYIITDIWSGLLRGPE